MLSNRGGTNINNGRSPFRSTTALILCMLAHSQGFLLHLNGIKPSLMSLVAPVLLLLSQVKMSAVRNVYRGMHPQSSRLPNQT